MFPSAAGFLAATEMEGLAKKKATKIRTKKKKATKVSLCNPLCSRSTQKENETREG